MVKFDVKQLRYLSREEFRCLIAVEMGMKNHEVVPSELIASIANLRHGGCYKILRDLVQYKLVRFDHRSGNRGYHLTYAGYDYLALKSLSNQEVVYSVGNKVGVGKESDIYIVADRDGNQFILKLHRLGRICFRKVKEKRDYLKHRKNASWLYLSRLAAEREYSFLKALHSREYPVPEPISFNRHAIVMALAPGYPMSQVREVANPAKVYNRLMSLIVRLAQMGLIHGDFNEFNLLIDDKERVTVIDLPQMISTSHLNAEFYFDRDVECIRTWFKKRYNFDSDERPYLSEVTCHTAVDIEMKASGYSKELTDKFEDLTLNKEHVSDANDSSDEDLSEGDISSSEDEEKLGNLEGEDVTCSPDRGGEHSNKGEEEEDDESLEEEEETVDSEDDGSLEASVPDNQQYQVFRDKTNKKIAAHTFKVLSNPKLSKDEIKKKVRESEAKKREKRQRIKKGEKYYLNREKRLNAREVKGAENWF